MANRINQKTDSELQAMLDVMAQNAPGLQAELGLSAAQLQEILDADADFRQAQDQAEQALNAYRSAVQAKADVRERAIELLSRRIATWKHDPSISSATLSEVGVYRNKRKRSRVPVFRPGNFMVVPNNTVNVLTWEPNGNEYRTVYVIESRKSVSEPWELVDFTTKTKFEHYGQTPGATVWYRVRAQRTELKSQWTMPSSVYFQENNGAAAA